MNYNGITILCEELDAHQQGRNGVDLIEITNFSIINGAINYKPIRRASCRNVLINNEPDEIEQLKSICSCENNAG